MSQSACTDLHFVPLPLCGQGLHRMENQIREFFGPDRPRSSASRTHEGKVLFAAKNQELCLFVAKWLMQRSLHPDHEAVLERMHVLFDAPEAPLSAGPRSVHVVKGVLETRLLDAAAPDYALVVVDEVHHLINDNVRWHSVQQYTDGTTFVLLGPAAWSKYVATREARGAGQWPHEAAQRACQAAHAFSTLVCR